MTNRGTTLVSVMVAVVILAIALVAATSTFIGASKVTKQAARLSAASNFAEGVLERTLAQPFAEVRSTQITDGLPALPGAKCAVEVRTPEDGLKEVTVTCSWTEGTAPHQATFSTLIARGRSR